MRTRTATSPLHAATSSDVSPRRRPTRPVRFAFAGGYALCLGVSACGAVREPQRSDTQAVLETVLAHLDAEGDTVRLVHGTYCRSMDSCPEQPTADAAAPAEIAGAAEAHGAVVAFPRNSADLPQCPWSDERGAAPGFAVWFAEPQIEGDAARVHVERACDAGGPTFGRGDGFGLVRHGATWSVERVDENWIS